MYKKIIVFIAIIVGCILWVLEYGFSTGIYGNGTYLPKVKYCINGWGIYYDKEMERQAMLQTLMQEKQIEQYLLMKTGNTNGTEHSFIMFAITAFGEGVLVNDQKVYTIPPKDILNIFNQVNTLTNGTSKYVLGRFFRSYHLPCHFMLLKNEENKMTRLFAIGFMADEHAITKLRNDIYSTRNKYKDISKEIMVADYLPQTDPEFATEQQEQKYKKMIEKNLFFEVESNKPVQ